MRILTLDRSSWYNIQWHTFRGGGGGTVTKIPVPRLWVKEQFVTEQRSTSICYTGVMACINIDQRRWLFCHHDIKGNVRLWTTVVVGILIP